MTDFPSWVSFAFDIVSETLFPCHSDKGLGSRQRPQRREGAGRPRTANPGYVIAFLNQVGMHLRETQVCLIQSDVIEINQPAEDSDLYDGRVLADHKPPSQGDNCISWFTNISPPTALALAATRSRYDRNRLAVRLISDFSSETKRPADDSDLSDGRVLADHKVQSQGMSLPIPTSKHSPAQIRKMSCACAAP